MKGFIEWFRPNARIKRWIFLILVGIILACYGISTIIVSEELEIAQLLLIILSFIVGFTCIVLGIVFMQKRTMEMLIESTDSRVKNNRKHINIYASSVLWPERFGFRLTPSAPFRDSPELPPPPVS